MLSSRCSVLQIWGSTIAQTVSTSMGLRSTVSYEDQLVYSDKGIPIFKLLGSHILNLFNRFNADKSKFAYMHHLQPLSSIHLSDGGDGKLFFMILWKRPIGEHSSLLNLLWKDPNWHPPLPLNRGYTTVLGQTMSSSSLRWSHDTSQDVMQKKKKIRKKEKENLR